MLKNKKFFLPLAVISFLLFATATPMPIADAQSANPPVISNFQVTPNVYVNPDNPVTISASVTDADGDLYIVYIMVADSNNLIGTDGTLIWDYMDFSGVDGVYSRQWDGKAAMLTSPTTQEYPITIRLYLSMGYLYYFPVGYFANPAAYGILLYDENMSLVAAQDMNGNDIAITDGVTTFTVQNYKVGTQQSVNGTTFTLYSNLSSPNNPQLTFVEVLNGIYSAFMYAVDGAGTGNDNWANTGPTDFNKDRPTQLHVYTPTQQAALSECENILSEIDATGIVNQNSVIEAFGTLADNGLISEPAFTFEPSVSEGLLARLQELYGPNLENYPTDEGRVWLLRMLS